MAAKKPEDELQNKKITSWPHEQKKSNIILPSFP
jgi:hypothetical protein